MKIGIIGLGLIGGSIAKAIKYNTEHSVLGTDTDNSTQLKAKLLSSIDGVLNADNIGECDLVIIATYPKITTDFITENASRFAKGSVVMDCCGVKEVICKPMWKLAKVHGFTFIGAHPMAGMEFSGFGHSRVSMFNDASMILVPDHDTGIEVLDRVKKLFLAIGFSSIQISTPEKHDRIIAYTSQLAHVVSNAYVKSPAAEIHNGYSAGSYKDMTRVARMNEVMWTELFLDNAKNLADEIDGLAARLTEYSTALRNNDEKKLRTLLRNGRIRKESIDGIDSNGKIKNGNN